MTKPLRFFCRYCRRTLTPAGTGKGTSYTKDHMRPQCDGGFRTTISCRDCNGLKDNIPLADWFWFIENHERWWKTFRSSSQVKRVIGAERARRAHAGEALWEDRSHPRP